MAAGGGHWVKSPFGTGTNAFMPGNLTKEGTGAKSTYALGAFKAEPAGKSVFKVTHEGEVVGYFGNEHTAVGTMTLIKASGATTTPMAKAYAKKAETKATTLFKKTGTYISPVDKIYSAFLDEIMNMGNVTPATTGGALFES